MKQKVFIQTNERQWLGALVSAYSLKRNSKHADAFDVEIMRAEPNSRFSPPRKDRRFSADGPPGSGAWTTYSRLRRCVSCRPR